jgi:hypothetical protein
MGQSPPFFCCIYGTTELPPHRRRPVDGDPGEVVPFQNYSTPEMTLL